MNSRRACLEKKQLSIRLPYTTGEKTTHAGLWLDKYIARQDNKGEEKRSANDEQSKKATSQSELVQEVCKIGIPDTYQAFYKRWQEMLDSSKAGIREARANGRLIVGLGSESVLETSVTLHHTYGIPYIPGSALKGLAASYAQQRLKWAKNDITYKILFGNTDEAGYITFFDALYIPESAGKQVLYPDIITVHHQKYYQGDNGSAPADWDSPNPVSFISATGSYLLALAAPDLSDHEAWIERTFEILKHALEDFGIGAKTSSGYGRMTIPHDDSNEVAKEPESQQEQVMSDSDVKKAEGYRKEIEALSEGAVANQIDGYYQKWQKLTSDEGRLQVARAIIDKVHKAKREKKSAGKKWYQDLIAFIDEKRA
jgi:CRISPR-associated protein Cmr6